ncbi:MAG: hypothetical protein BWX80_03877 [Candidatus Hydrogenedentes bacterium ADurb.Bin101]|nr:MAG: hypothetical protein BWX80_03877 [Candidatus Hydrogenedentes bacterium ADurb.Bin101]
MAYDGGAVHTPPANAYDDRPMLLGAGWMPLGVPAFPEDTAALETPAWLHTVKRAGEIAAEQRAFLEKDREALATVGLVAPGLDAQGQYWAALLLNRLRMRSHYLEAMLSLNDAYRVFQETALKSGVPEAKRAIVPLLDQSVSLARQCVELYAKEIRNRNDLGVVAQMNVQVLQVLEKLRDTMSASVPEPVDTANQAQM